MATVWLNIKNTEVEVPVKLVDADLGLVLTGWTGAIDEQGSVSEREASIVTYIGVKLLWKLEGFFL